MYASKRGLGFDFLLLLAFLVLPDTLHNDVPFPHLTLSYLQNTLEPKSDCPSKASPSSTASLQRFLLLSFLLLYPYIVKLKVWAEWILLYVHDQRSEERRVGKECRSRWTS